MTDISTHQQSLALTSSPTRGLRVPLTFLKHLFRSRRTSNIDLHYANEHLLRDIGLSRRHEGPPFPCLEGIFDWSRDVQAISPAGLKRMCCVAAISAAIWQFP